MHDITVLHQYIFLRIESFGLHTAALSCLKIELFQYR